MSALQLFHTPAQWWAGREGGIEGEKRRERGEGSGGGRGGEGREGGRESMYHTLYCPEQAATGTHSSSTGMGTIIHVDDCTHPCA